MKTCFLALPLALLLALPVSAAPCPNTVDMFHNVQGQSFWYKSMNSCAVQISPVERGPKWRSYLFFSTGLFMVFNSLGAGPESTSTASRSFFLFPRLQHPTYSFSRSSATVSMAQGSKLFFDFTSAHIRAAKGLEVTEDPTITATNQGGVEILNHAGILLDTGYFVGEMAHTQPGRLSLLRDSHGKSCKIVNSDLFNYRYETDAYGKKYLAEVTLKYTKDRNFGQFLKKQCPLLDVSALIRSRGHAATSNFRGIL